jgi:virulence factor
MSGRPLRVAVVGLGDIATKAYLPVLAATAGVEVVPCTRDEPRRAAIAAQYRLGPGVATVDALARLEGPPLDAAFVHVATSAHEPVVAALLDQGLPVFVDKPLADTLPACERLAEHARMKGLPLMVGFNRRFAPRVRAMAGADGRCLVRLDKHRAALMDGVRRVVFDDFIHVVDTLRYLAPGPVPDIGIHGAVLADGRLRQVSLRLEGDGFRLEGTMNRDAGAAEEMLEVLAPGHTWRIDGLSTLVHAQEGRVVRHEFGDWEPVLWRRGFPQMVAHFLAAVRGETPLAPSLDDVLATHAMCEEIVQSLAPGA